MGHKTGETIAVQFCVSDPATAGLVDADSLPTGTLVLNGVDDAATVAITKPSTGTYKAVVTLPTVTDGDELQIRVNATVATVAGGGIVWQGEGVTKRPADVDATLTAMKGVGWTTETMKAIKDAVDSTGTGAWTCTITVDDGDAPTVLEGARVRVTKGAESYAQETDASGEATFNLNDGSWVVAITLAGYTYSGTTLVVDGDEAVTYSMTAASFMPSTEPATITIRGTCYGADRLPVGAGESVQLRIKSVPGSTAGIWDKGNQTQTTDANGVVQFTDVIPGSELLLTCGDNQETQATTIPTDATSPYDIGPLYGVFD